MRTPTGPDAAPNGSESARHPALSTRACERFGVRYPLVQTGMGWVSGARLTAATAAAGGLGILASATMTLDELGAAIDKVASVCSAASRLRSTRSSSIIPQISSKRELNSPVFYP